MMKTAKTILSFYYDPLKKTFSIYATILFSDKFKASFSARYRMHNDGIFYADDVDKVFVPSCLFASPKDEHDFMTVANQYMHKTIPQTVTVNQLQTISKAMNAKYIYFDVEGCGNRDTWEGRSEDKIEW